MSRTIVRILTLCAMLGIVQVASAATIEVPGAQATLTAALAVAGDGDTINFAAGDHAGGTITPPAIGGTFDLTLTGVSGAVLGGLTQSDGNTVLAVNAGTTTALNLTIQDLDILSTGTVGAGHAMQINQNTSGAITVSIDNSTLTHGRNTMTGTSAIFVSGLNVQNAAPITINGTDSTIRNYRSTRGAIDIRNSLSVDNFTLNLTDCTVEGGVSGNPAADGTGGAIVLDCGNSGNIPNTATCTDNMNITITRCTISSTARDRGAITWGRSGATRINNMNGAITDSTIGGGAFRCFESSDNHAPGNQHWVLNRCTILGHESGRTDQHRAVLWNHNTANNTTSTLLVMNCVITSQKDSDLSTTSGGNNQWRAFWTEGQSESRLYHNTIVAPNGIGNAGVYSANPGAPTYVHLVNNILYNYKVPITGASGSTFATWETTGVLNIPGTTNSKNLIVGPNDDTNDAGTNHLFVQVTSPVLGTDELDTNYVPLAGSEAIDNADPDSAVSTAIGRVDRDNTDRGELAQWDIGAFETNPVPVEMSEFSIE
jgi:hypothetical protein